MWRTAFPQTAYTNECVESNSAEVASILRPINDNGESGKNQGVLGSLSPRTRPAIVPLPTEVIRRRCGGAPVGNLSFAATAFGHSFVPPLRAADLSFATAKLFQLLSKQVAHVAIHPHPPLRVAVHAGGHARGDFFGDHVALLHRTMAVRTSPPHPSRAWHD